MGIIPPCACGILREQHGEAGSPLQVAFEYSDGGGNVLVKKVQAEPETPGGPLRWIANGKTILNNKGKPVKQYEPSFTDSHSYSEPLDTGVTPIMYYDAPGRLIRTELPDGAFSRVEFSPWHVTSYDPNDTVLEPGNAWYAQRTAPTASAAEQRAARIAEKHADTPATVFLDSLGREVISVAHNRVPDDEPRNDPLLDRPWHDERYVTFTKLDTEGKPLWIRDARGNLVMQYISPVKPTRAAAEPDPTNPETIPIGTVPCYDIAGNLLFQHSMDAGDRWMLMDSTGQPFYAWDENEQVVEGGAIVREARIFHTTYDELRRPKEQRYSVDGGGAWQVVERFEYRDPALASPSPDPEAANLNLGGQIYRHYDPSGRVTNEGYDFKGNLLVARRRLARDYTEPVLHWPEGMGDDGLEPEELEFTQRTEYDALNRMVRQENWHLADRIPAIYTPTYNERSLLAAETLSVHGEVTEAIRRIEYDAKGQRTLLELGNNTITQYDYDPQTFRLIRLRTNHHRGSRVFQDLQYTYDPSGNITAIRDDAQQTIYFNTRIEPHNRYVYDALYRLIQAEGREHAAQNNRQRDNRPFEPIPQIPFPNSPEALQRYVEDYEYDSVGNILSMSHTGGSVLSWKRCYQYAVDSNRLLATGRPGDLPRLEAPCSPHYVETPTLSERYDYDIHGNMLNLVRTGTDYNLRWDYRDMIHRVNLGGGGWAYYNYDANKQRTRKVITNRDGDKQWERFYLGGMEVYRRYGTSGVVEEIETHHLFVDDQRVLIVEDVQSSGTPGLPRGVLFRYQYSNHLGSACLELNAVAEPISYEEYHPYGTTAYQAKNAAIRAKAKRYRYTGMERDEETGLNYHTSRYYLSWLGRWCSTDAIGIKGGLNLFAYAGSNPLSLGDRLGTQPVFFRREFWQAAGERALETVGEAGEAMADLPGQVLDEVLGQGPGPPVSIPEDFDDPEFQARFRAFWESFPPVRFVEAAQRLAAAISAENPAAAGEAFTDFQINGALSLLILVGILTAARGAAAAGSSGSGIPRSRSRPRPRGQPSPNPRPRHRTGVRIPRRSQRYKIRRATRDTIAFSRTRHNADVVAAGTYDPVTNETYYATNRTPVPREWHPLLRENAALRHQLTQAAPNDQVGYRGTAAGVRHAELASINEALYAREAWLRQHGIDMPLTTDDLGDLMTDIRWTRGARRGLPAPRCAGCIVGSEGSPVTPAVRAAEEQQVRPILNGDEDPMSRPAM